MMHRVTEWQIEEVSEQEIFKNLPSRPPFGVFHTREEAKFWFKENLMKKIEAAREMIEKCEDLLAKLE